MFEKFRYQTNQNWEVSDLPTFTEMSYIDDAQDLIADAIFGLRPEILSNYFDSIGYKLIFINFI